MRIGFVKFLNAIPFTDISYDVIYDVPSALNAKLHDKTLDVAFASSIEYFRGDYDLLPGICLAAYGKISSVHLYLKEGKKIDQAAIYLDPASNTSNVLFKILAHYYWKTPIHLVSTKEECDGFVLIGDEALRKQRIEGYMTYDLATLWHKMTGLPFVFALFIKQKGLETEQLERELNFSLERFTNNFGKNVERIAKEHHLPPTELANYFKLCHYRLGEKEMAGLQRFGELYHELHAVHT